MSAVWGVPADQAIAQLKGGTIAKWNRETAWWRLHDHALALAREGCSREDALEYLRSYNRDGSEIPQWFEGNLPGIIKKYEEVFAEMQADEELTARHTPPNPDKWGEMFHSYDEIANAPALTFAIHGWLQAEGITMYGGLPGHGKTLLGLSTARALLTGEPLFGYEYFEVQRARRVLYLCPEVGLGPLAHRLKLVQASAIRKEWRSVHPFAVGSRRAANGPQDIARG
jgi:hypothetical protein